MQIERSKDKLACLYCRDAAADDNIVQIESRTQACLSMTEMQAMTQSVNTTQGECRTTELAWLYNRRRGNAEAYILSVLMPSASASATQVMIANAFATCDSRLERFSPL